MGRLIDEDNVISSICSFCDRWDCNYNCSKIQEIRKIPTAQPEQKIGKWIQYDEQYECSECGVLWEFYDGSPEANNANYCPNCGAKMVEK